MPIDQLSWASRYDLRGWAGGCAGYAAVRIYPALITGVAASDFCACAACISVSADYEAVLAKRVSTEHIVTSLESGTLAVYSTGRGPCAPHAVIGDDVVTKCVVVIPSPDLTQEPGT